MSDAQKHSVDQIQRLDSKVDGIIEDLKQLRTRQSEADRVFARQVVTDVDQDAQIERLKSRVDRIEQRLGISNV